MSGQEREPRGEDEENETEQGAESVMDEMGTGLTDALTGDDESASGPHQQTAVEGN